MSTEDFYDNLPILDNFNQFTDFKNYVTVPDDWFIIITDVIKSTKAIEEGRYKDVNLIGSAAIATILNIAKYIDVPFIFGGDGATLLIPPSLVERSKKSLEALVLFSKRAFELELRAGIIPVSKVFSEKKEIYIAKTKISKNYIQAVFRGGGISFATELLKNPLTNKEYLLNPDPDLNSADADLNGLECRWQDVFSKQGQNVSLLLQPLTEEPEKIDIILKEALSNIEKIYGSQEDSQPAPPENLFLSFNPRILALEASLTVRSNNFFLKKLYTAYLGFKNLIGLLLIKFKVKTGELHWKNFKNIISESTDYRKFDDCLRMIISGNVDQGERLEAYLAEAFKKGQLVYGIHLSNRATITCLVFDRNGRQVHFVDGADGGYAMAAKDFKQRLERFKKPV